MSNAHRPTGLAPIKQVPQPFALLILYRALGWLDENPDKHITGREAAKRHRRLFGLIPTKELDTVAPLSDEAECFCFVGRVAREMYDAGIETSYACAARATSDLLDQAFPEAIHKPFGATPCVARLIDINDHGLTVRTKHGNRASPETRDSLRRALDRAVKSKEGDHA